jgi:hypothetical protein
VRDRILDRRNMKDMKLEKIGLKIPFISPHVSPV